MSGKTIFKFIGTLLILATLSSCATVFGGRKNAMIVEQGTPPNAEVYLDGQKIGEAPLKQKIDKYQIQKGSLIEIQAKGYETKAIEVDRKVHPYYMLADILIGGVGVFIDVATGNIYRPDYGKINYELEKVQ